MTRMQPASSPSSLGPDALLLRPGFESVGAVVAAGPGVSHLRPGQPVATVTYGGFSDFAAVPAAHLLPIPEASPEVVAMLTSGLTASIGKAVESRASPVCPPSSQPPPHVFLCIQGWRKPAR